MDEKRKNTSFPKEPCKLDTVIHNGINLSTTTTVVEADENIRKIDVTIDGEVIAVDESRYQLPPGDTLTYYISSMVRFLDRNQDINGLSSRHAGKYYCSDRQLQTVPPVLMNG